MPLLCFAESIIVGGVAKKPVKESFWNRIRWHYILSRLSEVVLVIFVYFLVRINSTVPGGVMTVLFGHEPGDIQDYMRDGEIEFSGWTAVIAGTTTNTRMVENPFAKLHGKPSTPTFRPHQHSVSVHTESSRMSWWVALNG